MCKERDRRAAEEAAEAARPDAAEGALDAASFIGRMERAFTQRDIDGNVDLLDDVEDEDDVEFLHSFGQQKRVQ